MVIFNQRAAAFCWNKQGECFGVLICRDGQNFKVLAHWTQTVNNIEAVAAALQQGYKQMALIDNDIVVAGEMGLRCSFADTEVPPMNTRDLYSSLQFSLANHFPVDSTELNWGYRILTSDHKASPLPVRLVALKTALWNEWLGNIGTLKVDQLISPAAVADAVIDDPVYIPFNEKKGFILQKGDNQLMQVQSCSIDDVSENIFGSGKTSLEHSRVDIGGIKTLDNKLQQQFSQAVLLAMYGLNPDLKKDKLTLFKTPKSLSPKRNILLKTSCAMLLIWLVMLGIFQYFRYVSKKNTEVAKITQAVQILEKQMELNLTPPELTTKLEELHTEMTEIPEAVIPLKEILKTVSLSLPDTFYLKDFNLSSNSVRFRVIPRIDIEEKGDTGEFHGIFSKLPLFENDVEILNRGTETSITLKIKEVVK